MAWSVVEECAMIHGLKLAFTGQEIIRALDERLAHHAASIQFKPDEIDEKTGRSNRRRSVPDT